MKKRPVPVTIVSVVLIATGAIGFVSHFTDFSRQSLFEYDVIGISLVSLAALLSGVCMLRAANWARWLAMAWIGFHVILSIFHSPVQVAVHLLVAAAFWYFLFRPAANDYFRGAVA